MSVEIAHWTLKSVVREVRFGWREPLTKRPTVQHRVILVWGDGHRLILRRLGGIRGALQKHKQITSWHKISFVNCLLIFVNLASIECLWGGRQSFGSYCGLGSCRCRRLRANGFFGLRLGGSSWRLLLRWSLIRRLYLFGGRELLAARAIIAAAEVELLIFFIRGWSNRNKRLKYTHSFVKIE